MSSSASFSGSEWVLPPPRRRLTFGNGKTCLKLGNLPPHVKLHAEFTLWLWQSHYPLPTSKGIITLRADNEFIAEETWAPGSAGGFLGGSFDHTADSVVFEFSVSGLEAPRGPVPGAFWEVQQARVSTLSLAQGSDTSTQEPNE